MTEELAFPIKATSFATVRFGIPIVMFLGLIPALFFGYMMSDIGTPAAAFGIPTVFIAIFEVIIPYFWLKNQRPSRVEITASQVTLISMPVMGFCGGKIVKRNLSEFKMIDAIFGLGPTVDRVDRVILRANQGYKDVTLDVSLTTNTIKYAKQLSQILNLPINLNPTIINVIPN